MKERLRAAVSHEMGQSEVPDVLCPVWCRMRDCFLMESPTEALHNKIRRIWSKSPYACLGQSQHA